MDCRFESHRRMGSTVVNPYHGGSIQITVGQSGKLSPLGEIARYWQRYLLIVVETKDGKFIVKGIDIPDPRQSKQVQVEFP